MRKSGAMKACAIIAAGGRGNRAKNYKQFLKLGGKPILIHVIEKFLSLDFIEQVIVSIPKGKKLNYQHKKLRLVTGGKERQQSVYNALALAKSPIVMIHDAARPFVSKALIRSVYLKAVKTGAAIAATKAKDTVKKVSHNVVEKTVDRNFTYLAQTPQAFNLDLIRKAHAKAKKENFLGTDDSQLVERLGKKVHIVESDDSNFKITTPFDIKFAKFLTKFFRTL